MSFIQTIPDKLAALGTPPPVPEEPEAPRSTQLRLPAAEIAAIERMIQSEYQAALSDHEVRLARCARQEAQWREVVGGQGGEQGKSNFNVPIIQAWGFAKHAREVEALFGAEATVQAVPQGPADRGVSERVSLAMKWQVFENMKALKPLSLWSLNRLKFGRSFAFVPYERKFFDRVRGGKRERVLYREGPTIYALDPDEIILPSSVEGCDTVQEARWAARRYYTSPADMLRMDSKPGGPQNPEGDWYQGIRAHWAEIVRYSRHGIYRDAQQDGVKVEKDLAEGVKRDYTAGRQERLEVQEWYIRWRRWAEAAEPDVDDLEIAPGFDGNEYAAAGTPELAESELEYGEVFGDGTFTDSDGIRKQMEESLLIVRFQPNLKRVVGIQDAAEVYPDSPTKIPILDLALMNDGTFWCMSLLEIIEQIQIEMSVLANQAIDGSDLATFPPILASPAFGDALADTKYEAKKIIWTADPNAAKQMDINVNLEPFTRLWQMFQSLLELLTGQSSFSMGRGMDQPNTPRTLGGQRLVMGAGDVRMSLDMRFLGDDLTRFVEWVWDLWMMYGNEQQFYRVAEGDAPSGAFKAGELKNGFAQLGDKERAGRYDFSLKFADDAQIREFKKQEKLALAQFLLSLPIVAANPVAQFHIGVMASDAFGEDFTAYMPEPPDHFLPKTSEHEWTLLLQGEEVHVHPLDNDEAHIADFERRILMMADAPAEDQNIKAILDGREHIAAHQEAMAQKRQAQQLGQMLLAMATAAGAQGKGGEVPLPADNPLVSMVQGGQGQPQQFGGMNG